MIGKLFKSTKARIIALIVAVAVIGMCVVPNVLGEEAVVVDYLENSTEVVATFVANDQDAFSDEGWSVGGTDGGKFDISFDGELSFKEAPDYEGVKQYSLTLSKAGGTVNVVVNIVNVDESGVIVLSALQPHVGNGVVTTELTDPDGIPVEAEWQWARSIDRVDWTNIEDADSDSYNPTKDDVDYYLRATAMYSDGFGNDRDIAGAVSDYVVETRPLANQAPSFEHLEDGAGNIARELDENSPKGSAVGNPISATDVDGDPLLYTIVKNNAFDIDRETGQLFAKTEFDFEDNLSTIYVNVTATDPSGADTDTGDEKQVVTVTVVDIDEAPEFDNPTLSSTIVENDVFDSVTYDATDRDDVDVDVSYFVEGADKDSFEINSNGVLTFTGEADYETQSEYNISVVATSGEAGLTLSKSVDVVITVTNVEETGMIILSQRQLQVGTEVVATLQDDDGDIQDLKWEWVSDTEVVATSANYVPTVDDVTNSLTIAVSYVDGFSDELVTIAPQGVSVRARPDANYAPVYEYVGIIEMVEENILAGKAIGAAVTATDADNDSLLYTLSGVDVDLFSIDRESGQLETKAELDYETRSTYEVVVTATDPSGATGSIVVMIKVEDVDDPANIVLKAEVPETIVVEEEPVNSVPVFDGSSVFITIAENTVGAIGEPVVATDVDGDELIYSLSDTSVFDVNADGQLVANGVLDYESGNVLYSVVLTVSDGVDSDSVDVYVGVTNIGLLNAGDTDDNGIVDRDEVLEILQLFFEESNR